MRHAAFLGPLAALALFTALPAAAADDAAIRQTLGALAAMDQALARVGQRLVTANVALCDRRQPALGLMLHGIEQYDRNFRAAARAMFGLGAAPGVALVLPGSPADRAGIRAGDALLTIDGAALPLAGPVDETGFDRMAKVLDRIEIVSAKGALLLEVEQKGERRSIRIEGVPACASRFQVRQSADLSASADGVYVQISSGLMAYAAGETEIAVIAAHELAHNILRHQERLDALGVSRGLLGKIGRNAALIRATEIEADRFSLRLLANAGYPLEAAPAYWRRFGPAHGHGIFSDSTHLRWKKRAALLDAEIAAMKRGG